MVQRNRRAARQRTERLLWFARRSSNIYWSTRGLLLTLSRRRITGRLSYFQFWLFAWTNSVPKYLDLSDKDFDIESIEGPPKSAHILPAAYDENVVEDIPAVKTRAQLRATTEQLRSLIEQRFADAG